MTMETQQRLFGFASVVAAIAIFVVGLHVPAGVADGTFYIIPILLALRSDPRKFTLLMAVLCTIAVICGYLLLPGDQVADWLRWANRGVSILVIWIAALLGYLLFHARRRQRRLEQILTMCAWTKKVKVEGEWMTIEEFLTKYYHLNITHGITEEAAKKLAEEAHLLLEEDER